MLLQLQLTKAEGALHRKYCHSELESIYGAGCIYKPDIMLMFMNPTARNVSSNQNWKGIRAPWLGTKNTWKLLFQLGLIDKSIADEIASLKSTNWNEKFSEKLYGHLSNRNIYITNLAKCTQPDARHLSDSVFCDYLPHTLNEIVIINPKKIITFGNQVSSVLLQKPVSVSKYMKNEKEALTINGSEFSVYPTYYPVGQGQRNLPKAIQRIKTIICL